MARSKKAKAIGVEEPFVNVFPEPIISQRNPGTNDRSEVGTLWVNISTKDAYILTSVASSSATWKKIT